MFGGGGRHSVMVANSATERSSRAAREEKVMPATVRPRTTYPKLVATMAMLLATAALGAVLVTPAVASPPSNDDFANARVIDQGGLANLPGTTVDATGEPDEPQGDGQITSVWYAWTAPASGKTIIHTCDSSYDTYLSVSTGSAVNALTRVAGNDDNVSCGLNPFGSGVAFDAVAGTTYRIAVDGF